MTCIIDSAKFFCKVFSIFVWYIHTHSLCVIELNSMCFTVINWVNFWTISRFESLCEFQNSFRNNFRPLWIMWKMFTAHFVTTFDIFLWLQKEKLGTWKFGAIRFLDWGLRQIYIAEWNFQGLWSGLGENLKQEAL